MYYCEKYLGCSGLNLSVYSKDGDLKFLKCNDCGLIWRSTDSQHLTKPYKKDYFISKNYLKRRQHKIKKSGWLLDIAQNYHSNLQNILEVGCSLGYTLEAARNRNLQHLGIDVSDYAVSYCKERKLNAEKQSLSEVKVAGKKFDLIFMQHVLEHFKNPFSTLQECYDLLNPGGLILILVPNSDYIRAVKQNSNHRFYSYEGVGTEHFVYLNYRSIRKVLAASGFEIIRENYPLFSVHQDSVEFFLNRLFRRLLSVLKHDQEIIVIAQKTA